MTDNGRKIYASEISTQYIFLGELNSRYPEIQIWANNNNFCEFFLLKNLILEELSKNILKRTFCRDD